MSDQNRFLIKISGRSLSTRATIELIKATHEKGKPFRFRTEGFSMSPFIKDGDVITITPKEKIPIRPGDIAAFVNPRTERLVIHRIIIKKGDYFVPRGDNTPQGDGLIPLANLLGRVIRVERGGRKIFFGLGIERYLIAFFSGKGILNYLRSKVTPLRKVLRPFIRSMLL